MKACRLTVQKTARYFIAGNIGQAKHIWFVCHGYGHTVTEFLEEFDSLVDDKTAVVAPEGLHRFYVKGFKGKVGASWMTSDDRENDIKDYVAYLNEVYKQVMQKAPAGANVTLLGFSQGAATVCRWLCAGQAAANSLILWAGMFPPDLNFEVCKEIFEQLDIRLVYGTDDPFIAMVNIEEQERLLKEKNVKYRLISFEGRHEIKEEVLKEIKSLVR